MTDFHSNRRQPAATLDPDEVFLGDNLWAKHYVKTRVTRLRVPRDGGNHVVFLADPILENLLLFIKSRRDSVPPEPTTNEAPIPDSN